MNARSFKTVFSKRLGALVAVGEHATSQGKANGASGPGASGACEGAASALAGIGYVAALSASFAFVSLAWAAPASNALPTGGTVVQGAASMSQTANQLNIQQATQRAAINWQSFNIGAAATVKVAQPSAQAVLLNRVVGQSPSQIFGKLQANGHVILVNPNGVLFGKDGSVNAGGFTASTLNISDANFMAGNMVYERNGSTAGIVNEGKISTEPGGYVALLGATVSNEGSITTKGGSVVMGAGETIKVPVSGTGRIKLELTPAAINASVSNSGSIVTEGGQVYMQALALNRAAAQILQSGSIDTTGEKGGDVHVLADGGHIRVEGKIKANSNNGTAGGDIYIGRDKDTNVLAAVGDVRDATLESQGGFIETSGSYLATNGVKITAKDWLLDPTNIRIVANNDLNTPNTVQSPASGTPLTTTFQDDAANTTSEILTSTIQDAINVGTNVTITTTNTAGTAGSGVGNITVVDPLDFTNNSVNVRTLKLIADNGIFVNADIKTNTAGNASGLIHIDMEAKGLPNGLATTDTNFAAGSSSGIVVNKTIATNGKITLKGTNNNNLLTVNDSRGITFNSTAKINAASFDIHGIANSTTSGSHGVQINGGATFTSTGTGPSVINGESKANITGITAGTNINGVGVRFDAQHDDGSIEVKGSNTNSGLGLRVSAAGDPTTISTKGNVTLGAMEANSTFSMRRGTITNEKGDLKIRGQSAILGVSIIGNSTIKTDGAGKNIDIQGLAATTGSGQFGRGVTIDRFPEAPKIEAKFNGGNINIEGTVTGLGTGSGVVFGRSGWGTQAVTMDADGAITIRGNNRASLTNPANAIFVNAGLQAKAVGNITLQAETNNAASTAINLLSEVGQHPFLQPSSQPLTGNTSLQSLGSSNQAIGNILIQANQGSIVFNNNAIANTSGSTETKLVGKNITIDNTGGSFDTQGNFTAGTGKATNVGVLIADGRAITASGNLNIAGASTGAVGINTNGVLTATNDVNLTGTSSGTNANAHGVFLTGKVNSTDGAVNITGNSTDSNGGAGAIIQATVDAKNNITLDGRSGNTTNVQGLVIQDAVTSVAGKITVTGETKAGDPGQRAVAITANGAANGSLKVKDGQTININANTLFINTASSVNAGTGTVNIKTLTAGNAIVIGGPGANDGMNTDLGKQTLGIDQTELNRITAGNLVIGDVTSAGSITVTGPVTTTAAMGHITLKTNGAIAIDQKLEVDASKTLTLIAGTTVSDNDTNGIIKASQLELLGNAAVTLDSEKHEVVTLAANVKSLDFRNSGALTVGAVKTFNSTDQTNGTVGITATQGVSVTTETGDLSLNQSISNSNSGNVVVGAGVSKDANDSSGGDVKGSATLSNTVTNGKVFVYSGSAANTGVLSGMNSGFTELKVTGDATQNAETNTAFGSGNGISINGTQSSANAQVIFREKLTVAAGVVAGTTLVKTYGDESTKNTSAAALLVEAKGALKNAAANSGTNSTFETASEGTKNRIVVSKAVVVDSLNNAPPLTGGETEGQFSTAGFLKAKTGTYQFAGLTSDKYTVAPLTVGVNVNKRDITIAATPTTVTFSGGTQTQAARTQSGEFLTGDKVEVTGGSASGTAVGTYNDGIVFAAAVPADLENYNVQVQNAPLTIVAAPVVPVIVPFIRPDAGNNTGSRVRTVSGFGGAGAATGVLDDKAVTESREVCSDVFPENCECQPSVIPSIEICFAPKSVAATKEEK